MSGKSIPARSGTGGLRGTVERHSAVPLAFLHQIPRWVLPLVLGGLLVAGLALPGPAGGVALLVLAAFLGWFAYLSWPSVDPRGRLLRAAALLVLLIIAITHFG